MKEIVAASMKGLRKNYHHTFIRDHAISLNARQVVHNSSAYYCVVFVQVVVELSFHMTRDCGGVTGLSGSLFCLHSWRFLDYQFTLHNHTLFGAINAATTLIDDH